MRFIREVHSINEPPQAELQEQLALNWYWRRNEQLGIHMIRASHRL